MEILNLGVNNMNKYEKVNKLFKISICAIVALFNVYIYTCSGSTIKVVSFIYGLIMIFLFFIYEKFLDKYIHNILNNVSNMIEMLIRMDDSTDLKVYSDCKDTLFSKLQMEIIKLSRMLKNQNENLQKEKDDIKSLISDISHQLKTPLSNLKLYNELTEDESLTREEELRFKKIISFSVDKLIFLVESFIKMSRLDSNIIKLKQEEASLNETVKMAINNVSSKAIRKCINIHFEQKDIAVIYHDKNWTCEAIFNIIENAVKYSKENSNITVTIEKYSVFCRIDIKNIGTEIKEEEMGKIFNRFYRGEHSNNVEGVGLGLYLSRKIISMEDGYIKVSSIDKETVFSIFLPLNKF